MSACSRRPSACLAKCMLACMIWSGIMRYHNVFSVGTVVLEDRMTFCGDILWTVRPWRSMPGTSVAAALHGATMAGPTSQPSASSRIHGHRTRRGLSTHRGSRCVAAEPDHSTKLYCSTVRLRLIVEAPFGCKQLAEMTAGLTAAGHYLQDGRLRALLDRRSD